MKKIGDTAESNALHAELCAALSDLAKSVEFAIKRRALRGEIETTLIDTKKVSEAAAELLAAAHATEIVPQNPVGVASETSPMPEVAQEILMRTTIVPDAEATGTDAKDTWVRSALESDVANGHQRTKNAIATSTAPRPSPDRTSSRANIQDSWVRSPGESGAETKRRSGKLAKANILEVYERLGAYTPKR